MMFNITEPANSFEWVVFGRQIFKYVHPGNNPDTVHSGHRDHSRIYLWICGRADSGYQNYKGRQYRKDYGHEIDQGHIPDLCGDFSRDPMIVQAMIVYYGLRQSGMELSSAAAGILVTVLNTGAYMAETVRAGINSVDTGQREGALAMGMSPLKTMFLSYYRRRFATYSQKWQTRFSRI